MNGLKVPTSKQVSWDPIAQMLGEGGVHTTTFLLCVRAHTRVAKCKCVCIEAQSWYPQAHHILRQGPSLNYELNESTFSKNPLFCFGSAGTDVNFVTKNGLPSPWSLCHYSIIYCGSQAREEFTKWHANGKHSGSNTAVDKVTGYSRNWASFFKAKKKLAGPGNL